MRESLRVKCGILKNGMRYYGQYDGSHSSWVSGIGVMAGSIYDPPGQKGMAHVTEHLITCRSKKYSPEELELIFRRYLGGPDDDINIRTDHYSTFYGHDLLLRRGYMLKVFDAMASLVHPKFRIIDPEMAKAEFAAVHNEYCLRGVDVAEALLDDEMHALMYDRNPARNRIDCDLGDLKEMTVRDVQRFLRRYYVPKNMFVIVLGPPLQEVRELTESYFGDWDTASTPILDYDHADDFPVLRGTKRLEIYRDVHQYHCGIGFPTETYLSSDAEAIEVLARIWEMRLTKLRDDNREFDGGVYRSTVNNSRSFTHGMIWARFATTNREFEKRAEGIVLNEARILRDDLVSSEELDAVTGRMLDEYTDAFTRTPDRLSERIIDAACNGDHNLERLHDFGNCLRKVTRAKLRDVAHKYFTKNHASVVIKPA